MKIKFFGAAKEVTGSCTLVETKDSIFLLDCGSRQGPTAEKGQLKFVFDPKDIDFAILSHAHIDHSGLLPRLVNEGFGGKIYSTVATRDVANLLLRDSAKIQQEEYEKTGNVPAYTEKDVPDCIEKFSVTEYDTPVEITDKIKLKFLDAGHILGAGISVVDILGVGRIVYTGDIGHDKSPILGAPAELVNCDYLIIESTYGSKLHPVIDPKLALKQIIWDTYNRKGKVLIPVFAVGRAQEVLYILKQLYDAKKLPNIPVYFDTPLGAEATSLYRHHQNYLRAEFRPSFLKGEDPFKFGTLDFIKGHGRSMDMSDSKKPYIVLAASGMLTGGRILTHLAKTLEDSNSSLIFVGYQAEGTLGREILNGKKEVELEGKKYRVKLKVHEIKGLSAHADAQGLFSFVDSAKILPKKVFVVHGEPENAFALQRRTTEKLRIDTVVPERGYEENFLEREVVVKVVKEKVHLDFIPQLVRHRDLEVQPFVGAVVKKSDGLHIISQEQFNILAAEQLQQMQEKLPKIHILEERPPAEQKITEEEFIAKAKEYFKREILSRKRVRDLIEILEKEGKDAAIAKVNKLAAKDRLYPADETVQKEFREFLVAALDSFPYKTVYQAFKQLEES